MSLESIDNVEGRDGLSLGVFRIGNGITNDTLEEGLKNTTGLLIDHARDTLDTATTSETADSGFGDSLNVVTKDLSVTLGTALSETFTAFAAW